jgi:hypothetical protein
MRKGGKSEDVGGSWSVWSAAACGKICPIPLVSWSALCFYAGCNRCDIAINRRDASAHNISALRQRA